ncbi:g2794 [Coccomyxa elongata]
MQNFPSPRLNAYLALLKDFQRALLPKPSSLIRSINQAPVADPHCFQFALGTSSHETLSRAVVECVQQIKHKLGHRNPDLCQLFITADTYGSNNIRFASAYVQECLSGNNSAPPVVLGGAVQSLMGQGSKSSGGQGVSLMAASLPNVRLFPFHATSASLPDLHQGSWKELVGALPAERKNGTSGPPDRIAGLILSEPHFLSVENLLARLRGAMPEAPMLGGVLAPNAWGSGHSLRGALFLNSDTHDEGAVGCLMRGPLRFDQLCWQGCRPVGRMAQVTGVNGNAITHLDNQPALLVMQRLFTEMDDSERLLPLQVGLDPTGTGSAFVARNLLGFDTSTLSVHVAVAAVEEGTLLQLHLRDSTWAQQGLRNSVREYAECLPADVRDRPDRLGAWLYSCNGVTHSEEASMQAIMPSTKLQGAKCSAEIGSWGSAARSTMLSYSSTFGFLHHANA